MTTLYGKEHEYNAINNLAPFGISAGAVVYRKNGDSVELLLLGKNKDSQILYGLPKGTLHVDETLEACALREIAEEAGVQVTLKAYIGTREEEHHDNGGLYRKTVHYYVAEYVGELTAMDNEHEFREWVAYDEALVKLQPNPKHEDVIAERAKEYFL